ncbi:MAG: patatin-like phospholipase family protein [Anaerolineales bacterium]
MSTGRVALVIGSGGVKCAAALGLRKVLRESGIELSMIVGCSAGSIYAGVLAMGDRVQNAEERSKEFWTSELMAGYTSNLRAVMHGEARFDEYSGLIDDIVAMERIRSVFGDTTFDDLDVPLSVVATELYGGNTVVLSNGKLVEAVRASIAIPMIFSPWEVEGQLLVDGAVSNPLPVNVAIKKGADIILAMGFEMPTRKRMRSYSSVTAHFNALYMNNILKSSYSFYNLAHHAEVIPVIPTFDQDIGTFIGDEVDHIIDRGAQATRVHIDYLKRLLASELPA